MREEHYPAVFRSANSLSAKYQRAFFLALGLHLIFLVIAAIVSVLSFSHWLSAALQAISFFGAFACATYLYTRSPDKNWYAGRAVAESVKTITWRYMCRAEPFQGIDANAQELFFQKVAAICTQNKEVIKAHLDFVGSPQLTDKMKEIRSKNLKERKIIYASERVKDQLDWYTNNAKKNQKSSNRLFLALIAANVAAMLLALFRIVYFSVPFWPTDIFIAIAASLLGWMQAKRFSDLAAAYGLAAHEIGIINEQCTLTQTEIEFSTFVGDSENAFSREHTQWVARKDL